MLFAHLPSPALAGAMAARLFAAQTWVSLVCGLLLLLLLRPRQAQVPDASAWSAIALVVTAMLLAALAEFAVAPRIIARKNLALWHSLGSGMFLLQVLCALLLFRRLVAPRDAGQS